MATEDDKVTAVFDLDTKEAVEKILHLKGAISSLGGEESVEGLVEGLMKVGTLVGVLGVSFFCAQNSL